MKILFKKKLEVVLLIFLLLVNILLKIPIQAKGFFAFAYDQGRDFLDVSRIIYEHKFTLIGQTTGIAGVFYGPWWYYFLSPVLFISGGDPQKVAIFFSIFAITTTICLYFLIKSITKNIVLAFVLTVTASMSSYWFGPTSIWNPSVVPILVIAYIFTLKKIFETNKAIYFFLLGLVVFLIIDGEAAFGISILIFQFIGILIYRKIFLNKKLALTLFGAIIVTSPRLIFDIRHNFLILNSIISYILHPTIHGSDLSFVNRFAIRLNQIFSIFSDSLFRNHKAIALIVSAIIILLFLLVLSHKKFRNIFKQDLLFQHLLLLSLFILLFFSIFKDNVWDYYLIGLPVIMICLIAKIFEYIFKADSLKPLAILAIISLLFFSFNNEIFKLGNITWQGDDATYKNPKAVIDYLASEKPTNYSLFAYSTSIYDYPIDYLVYWYTRKKLLEKPKENQKTIYLIIRDDETHKYLSKDGTETKQKIKLMLLKKKHFMEILF